MGDVKVNTIKTNTLQASTGSNIAMTSGHTIQPNFHSSTAFPAGHVIQTVTNTGTSNVVTTSQSAQDIISASITPQFTDSIIHIEGFVSRLEIIYGSSNAYASLYLIDPSGSGITTGVSGNSGHSNSSPATIFGSHSPNATSSKTYKMMFSTSSGGTQSTSTDSQRYTIKLTEIAV